MKKLINRLTALAIACVLVVMSMPVSVQAACPHDGFQWYSTVEDTHQLSCGMCGDGILPQENHDDVNGDGLCDICGVGVVNDRHTHVWSNQWSSSDAHHFYDCTDSACTTSTGAESHDDSADGDGKCDKCGYVVCQHPAQKTDSNGKFVYEPTGPASHHAVCAVCDQTYGNGVLHVDNDNNQICDDCGDTVNCLHQNVGRWWDTDEKEHTLYCTCGYPVQPTVVHTDAVKNSDKSAGSDNLCDECNVSVQLENGELVHKHTVATLWIADIANTEHFNRCTDSECTRLFNAHTAVDADNDGECDVCNYSMTGGSQGGNQPCVHGHFWVQAEKYGHQTMCGYCGDPYGSPDAHIDADGDERCDDCWAPLVEENGTLVHNHNKHPHGWYGGTVAHFYKCDTCGMTEFQFEPHVDADQDSICDVCKVSLDANLEHYCTSAMLDFKGLDEDFHAQYCTECYREYQPMNHVDADNDDFCDDCKVTLDSNDIHVHQPDGNWAEDGKYEHCCKCTECEDWIYESHSDADGDAYCDICKYDLTCKHDRFLWYGTDEEFHELHCGDCGNSIANMEYHKDADGDTKCDVCGVGVVNNLHTHVWSTSWNHNDTGHWHPCADSACTTSLSSFAHEDDNNDGNCDVCGYGNKHEWCQNHWHNGQYAHTDDYHYTMCGDCWNAYGAGIAHHGADGYRVETDKHYPVCVDCWMSYGPGVAHADTDNDGYCDECGEYLGAFKVGGVNYATFDDALDAANANGGTIVLLRDYIGSQKVNPQITNHVVIDSNGYQFAVTGERFGQLSVEAGASLTLTGNGTLYGGNYVIPILVKEGAALIVEEDFNMDISSTSDIENHGTVIFKGTGKTVYNVGNGVAHIYGSIGAVVNDGGIVHIYDGAVLTGKQFPISNNLKGTVNIYGGTIDGTIAVSASSGVINIEGGTILCPLEVSKDNTNYASDPQIGSYQISGGSFPNGISVEYDYGSDVDLSSLLAKDHCYLLNGAPVILVPGQMSVSGGNVTVGMIAPAPVITKQPADVEVNLGERFSISPQVLGNGLTYQWYYKDSYMKDFKVSSNKTPAYAYAMQSYMHERQVYCVITDQYGQQVTTSVATITRPPMALKLLAQPADTCNPVGQKFSVKPQVQGDGLTYQWYYKDSYMKDFAVSSNKTSAYAYSMQSYMHNRQVYCVITDQYGNQVTTDVATITRLPMELKILSQPEDVYATVGQKFRISAQVQGDGLTYQWYYKEGSGKKFAASSNKTSAYAYSMQNYMNNRQVYCVITDQYGNQVTTDVVTIHVEK